VGKGRHGPMDRRATLACEIDSAPQGYHVHVGLPAVYRACNSDSPSQDQCRSIIENVKCVSGAVAVAFIALAAIVYQ
jgi:uncharacterized membrane protein